MAADHKLSFRLAFNLSSMYSIAFTQIDHDLLEVQLEIECNGRKVDSKCLILSEMFAKSRDQHL